MMFLIIIAILTIGVKSAEILHQNKFLLDNENWSIIGNKNYEPAVHQSYNIDKDLSHYIMFKDNLINVDHKNKNDQTLWYFRSPDIIITKESKPGTLKKQIKQIKQIKNPKLLTFTMTSFVGDFSKLNEDVALVKLKNSKNCLIFKAPVYDGKTLVFNVPIINTLWDHEINNKTPVTQEELNNMFIGPLSIEILGDWTQGMEVVAIDNFNIM